VNNQSKILNEYITLLKQRGKIKYNADISRDLEYSKGSLSSYISGKLEPSRSFMEKFKKFYNLEHIEPNPANKFQSITTELRQQPHTNSAPVLNADQESVLLMAINSSTYTNTELLCRALAILENRPLDDIKKEATELTRERARRVEQVLDQLVVLGSSGNSTKSDSN